MSLCSLTRTFAGHNSHTKLVCDSGRESIQKLLSTITALVLLIYYSIIDIILDELYHQSLYQYQWLAIIYCQPHAIKTVIITPIFHCGILGWYHGKMRMNYTYYSRSLLPVVDEEPSTFGALDPVVRLSQKLISMVMDMVHRTLVLQLLPFGYHADILHKQ